MMKEITFQPIGYIRSPFTEPRGTPIQPPAARGVAGTVEVLSQYVEGLADLEGFSHIILIYLYVQDIRRKLQKYGARPTGYRVPECR